MSEITYDISTIENGEEKRIRRDVVATALPRIGETVSFYVGAIHGMKDYKVLDVKYQLFPYKAFPTERITVYV